MDHSVGALQEQCGASCSAQPRGRCLAGSIAASSGFCVFDHTRQAAIGDYSGAKAAIDAQMAEDLGDDLAPWQLHDLRRTVRTRLSQLRIPFEICELAIGHAKKGLQRTYDQHQYADELQRRF
jgi:hypothetical protein